MNDSNYDNDDSAAAAAAAAASLDSSSDDSDYDDSEEDDENYDDDDDDDDDNHDNLTRRPDEIEEITSVVEVDEKSAFFPRPIQNFKKNVDGDNAATNTVTSLMPKPPPILKNRSKSKKILSKRASIDRDDILFMMPKPVNSGSAGGSVSSNGVKIDDDNENATKSLICKNVGRRYVCGGGSVILASVSDPCLWVTECSDFNLITTEDFTPLFSCLPTQTRYRLNDKTGKFIVLPKKLRRVKKMKSDDATTLSLQTPPSWDEVSLKASQNENWRFVLHVSHGMRLSITRDVLRARVMGGQILAYQYTECSIEGNEACYYGYLTTKDSILTSNCGGTGTRLLVTAGTLPARDGWTWKGLSYTGGFKEDERQQQNCEDGDENYTTTAAVAAVTAVQQQQQQQQLSKDERVVLTKILRSPDQNAPYSSSISTDEGVHRICRVSAHRVWPRRLNVYMRKDCACTCSPNCSRWTVQLRDLSFKRRVCARSIPWPDLYIMMGGTDETSCESIKEIRNCVVCAQCFQCSRGPSFCRRHKVCRHQGVKTYGSKRKRKNNDDDDNDNEDGSGDRELLEGARMKKCFKLS